MSLEGALRSELLTQSYRDYLASEMKIAFPALSNAIDSVNSRQQVDKAVMNGGAPPGLQAVSPAINMQDR